GAPKGFLGTEQPPRDGGGRASGPILRKAEGLSGGGASLLPRIGAPLPGMTAASRGGRLAGSPARSGPDRELLRLLRRPLSRPPPEGFLVVQARETSIFPAPDAFSALPTDTLSGKSGQFW